MDVAVGPVVLGGVTRFGTSVRRFETSGSTSDDSHTVSLLFQTTAFVPTAPVAVVPAAAVPDEFAKLPVLLTLTVLAVDAPLTPLFVPLGGINPKFVPAEGFTGMVPVIRLTVNDSGGGGGSELSGETV